MMQASVPLSFSIPQDPNFNVFEVYEGVKITDIPSIPTEEEFRTQKKFFIYDLNGRRSKARERGFSFLQHFPVMTMMTTSCLALSIIASPFTSLAPYAPVGVALTLFLLSQAIRIFAMVVFKRNQCDYPTYLQSRAREHLQADSVLHHQVVPHKAMAMLFMKAVDPSKRDAELLRQASEAFNTYLSNQIHTCVLSESALATQYAYHFLGEKSRQFDTIYEWEVKRLCKKGRFQEAIEVTTHITHSPLRDERLTTIVGHIQKDHLEAADTRKGFVALAAQCLAKVENPGRRNDLYLDFSVRLLPYSLKDAFQFLYHIDALFIEGRGKPPVQRDMNTLVDNILKHCHAQEASSFPFEYALDAILLLGDVNARLLRLDALKAHCKSIQNQDGELITQWFIDHLTSIEVDASIKREKCSSYIRYKQKLPGTSEQLQTILAKSEMSDKTSLQVLSSSAQARFAAYIQFYSPSITMRVYVYYRLVSDQEADLMFNL